MSSVLTGSLVHFSPVQIIQLLKTEHATGRLQLKRDEETADLYVEYGRTLFIRTNGASIRVGDILIHRGDLRPEAIELALAVQHDRPGERIGHMLIESGTLSEEQLREALLVVQRHILCGVLLWREGTFDFHEGDQVQEEDVRLDLVLDPLVVSVLSHAGSVHDRRKLKKAS
jgi:Domain of unknown function (DUF4388)